MISDNLIKNYASARGTSNLVLTVGTIDNGEMEYKVYGHKGAQITKQQHRYEIGSLTKSIMMAKLCQAISEGKVSPTDKIGTILDENISHNPTIEQLATHTARYGNSYPKHITRKEMKNALFSKDNPYCGYKENDILNDIENFKPNAKHREWVYSHFGGAVMGEVLSKIYDKDIKTIIEETVEELGLENTGYTGDTEIGKCWKWNGDEVYAATSGLVSTVNDMMKFVQENIECNPEYLALGHKKYYTISKGKYDMGLGWVINDDTKIIWHDGSTDNFDCFIGFEKHSKKGVVVLSNYPNKGEINAAKIGLEKITELVKNRK